MMEKEAGIAIQLYYYRNSSYTLRLRYTKGYKFAR